MDLNTKPYSIEDITKQFLSGKKPNTVRNYIRALSLWVGYLQMMNPGWTGKDWQPLLEADVHRAKDFLWHLRKYGLAFNTIGLYRMGLIGFYDEVLATGFNISGGNPFANRLTRLPRGSQKAANPTQALEETNVLRLLAEPDRSTQEGKRDYALMCVLFGGGLRRGEVIGVTFNDIEVTEGVTCLVLRNTKTHIHRKLGLPPWAAKGLLDFVSSMGPVIKSATIFNTNRRCLHYWFKGKLKKCGIEGRYSLHSCRKTAINTLLEHGLSHREVMPFSGHCSVRTVEIYDAERRAIKDAPGLRLAYGDMR